MAVTRFIFKFSVW